MPALTKLLEFIKRLDSKNIKYYLDRTHPDAIRVSVEAPGERWEIVFYIQSKIEVQVFPNFASAMDKEGEEALDRLFAKLPAA